MSAAADDTDYRATAARRGMLYVNGVAHDVLVLRETRGRYQVRLPDGCEPGTRIVVTRGRRVLTVGNTTSVPKALVELR